MASPQCSVRAAAPAVAPPVPVRSAFECPAPTRPVVPAGRAARPVAPVTVRRGPVRPGARPARLEGVAVLRPAGGGCGTSADRSAARGRPDADGVLPPLRLTLRGRRVVAGLSVAIGLSIAAVTATVVQVSGGGLQTRPPRRSKLTNVAAPPRDIADWGKEGGPVAPKVLP